MNAQIEDLANVVRTKRDAGQKFVIMLGAGAAMSSGVVKTPQIMEELLAKYGQRIAGANLRSRFDQLWEETPDGDREVFLKPYLAHDPSPGYTQLAKLIAAEFFDLVVTFNYDDLLETALQQVGFTQIKTIIRGETRDEEMQKLIEITEPRFKIAKLHGSLKSSAHFLFTSGEMYKYPESVESLLKGITTRDVIVCGYGFEDHCVLSAFAQQGGSIVNVNPSGVPTGLRPFLKDRRSERWSIELRFDEFFDELYGALLVSRTPSAPPKPRRNPFKFLESYAEADRGTLIGRDEETADFVKALGAQTPPRVMIVAGPPKAGKTSLVKAALLPGLDPATHAGFYVRCKPDLEKSLPEDLLQLGLAAAGADLVASLQGLAQAAPDRHVVLFLDQFDRVTRVYNPHDTKAGSKELSAFLTNVLFKGLHDKLTLVLIVTDEGPLGGELLGECTKQGVSTFLLTCRPFDPPEVAEIIQKLARIGEIEFGKQTVADMTQRYEQTRYSREAARRFTLAHIQAVCHILATTTPLNDESYKTVIMNVEALHNAINVCDIISFVEDFPWPNNAWLRTMIKVALQQSKDRIAEYIMAHYEDLMPQEGSSRRSRPIASNGGRHQP